MTTDTETKTKQHTMPLTNGAVELIKETLCTPGWYGDEPRMGYLACQISSHQLMDFAAHIDEGVNAAELEQWRNKEHPLTVSEDERECIKACVRYYLRKAAFRPTSHLAMLLYELGLTNG